MKIFLRAITAVLCGFIIPIFLGSWENNFEDKWYKNLWMNWVNGIGIWFMVVTIGIFSVMLACWVIWGNKIFKKESDETTTI